jgi:hypothetical protein
MYGLHQLVVGELEVLLQDEAADGHVDRRVVSRGLLAVEDAEGLLVAFTGT